MVLLQEATLLPNRSGDEKMTSTTSRPGKSGTSSTFVKSAMAVAFAIVTAATATGTALADNNINVGDNWGSGGSTGPKLKSGSYCTSDATAQVSVSKQQTTVAIKGSSPDRRGVAGKARNGFSGEGFSIVPVSKKKIRIDQAGYGISRTFKRC